MYDYSIVVPVFNSELTLAALYDGLVSTFKGKLYRVQYIFVDDGSFDRSWEVLTSIKEQNQDDVVLVRLNKNYGQGNSTFCGVEIAEGNYIITIDDDLQQPPSEILKLIETINAGNWDLVYGVFDKKKDSFFRKMSSKFVRGIIGRFLERPDKTTSFRIVKKEIVDRIVDHKANFIFIDELLWWYTDSISYVLVDHKRRAQTKSGYTPGKLISLLANLLIYYTNFPLKLMIYGGLFFSIVFMISIVGFLIAKFMNNTPLGYSSIMISIMFGTSIILLSLGIIGEYISRLYSFQNRKPPFIIKEIKK